MKLAYLSHPSAFKPQGILLTKELRDLGWIIMNPFEQNYIDGNLVKTELEMIAKADYLIVYYPEKVFSFGTPIEVYWANRCEKHIYLLSTDEIYSYPFVNNYIPRNHFFTDHDKFIKTMRYITE